MNANIVRTKVSDNSEKKHISTVGKLPKHFIPINPILISCKQFLCFQCSLIAKLCEIISPSARPPSLHKLIAESEAIAS